MVLVCQAPPYFLDDGSCADQDLCFLHAGQRVVGVPTLPNNTDVRLLKGAVRHLDGRAGPLEGTVLGVRANWLHVTWLKNICGRGAVPLAAWLCRCRERTC